jgi:HTH-type transcriptional regulator / antitoxin HigA
VEKMISQLTDIQSHWTPIAPIFSLRTDADYDTAVARLNELLDEVGTNEKHPLYSLLDTLGTLIYTYEEENLKLPNATGPEVLRLLMEQHDLSNADLPEIGDRDTVEAYLAGNVELSVGQVRFIANRFHVSPAAFI